MNRMLGMGLLYSQSEPVTINQARSQHGSRKMRRPFKRRAAGSANGPERTRRRKNSYDDIFTKRRASLHIPLSQRALCSSSFACSGGQNALAQAKRLRCYFYVLVNIDVFDRALQTHSQDAFELNSFAVTLAAHVREVLFLAWIDWQIFRTAVFADDHSLVNLLLWTDEKTAALLDVVQCVGSADPGLHGNHDTTAAASNVAFKRRVFAKQMAHQPLTAGLIHEISLESN